ncbi:hypothetical protein MMC13_004400 [Lambiella insularis]|nr:hypothetical protein [Lambiella insularis]
MEKTESQVEQVDQPNGIAGKLKVVDEGLEPAVVGAYFAQVFHVVGAGFLAGSVTTVVGGQD